MPTSGQPRAGWWTLSRMRPHTSSTSEAAHGCAAGVLWPIVPTSCCTAGEYCCFWAVERTSVTLVQGTTLTTVAAASGCRAGDYLRYAVAPTH